MEDYDKQLLELLDRSGAHVVEHKVYFGTSPNALSLLLTTQGSDWGGIYGKTDVNDGRWHHVAGTYDGRQSCLYVDGRLDASASTKGKIKINDQSVFIGANADKPNRNWNGLIDDVRIYNYALSAEQIAQIAAAAK